MNGCEHSIDPVKMPNTPRQMSSCAHLIVSHLHRSFSLCCTTIFTGRGLISHVVISSVLVWTQDARKRTSPEVCIPTATCHFSHRGHKSSPKARKTTQSQEHDTTGKLFSCLFDLMALWTLAEQVTCSIDLKKIQKKVHLQLHYCICISLKWALLAVSATPFTALQFTPLSFYFSRNNRGH